MLTHFEELVYTGLCWFYLIELITFAAIFSRGVTIFIMTRHNFCLVSDCLMSHTTSRVHEFVSLFTSQILISDIQKRVIWKISEKAFVSSSFPLFWCPPSLSNCSFLGLLYKITEPVPLTNNFGLGAWEQNNILQWRMADNRRY